MLSLTEIAIALISVILTIIFTKQYLNILKARKSLCYWIQPAPRVPVLGSVFEFQGGATKLVENCTRLSNNPTKSFYFELFFKWTIITRDYDLLEFILSSNTIISKADNYKWLVPWLGTGLVTSTGSKWKNRRRIITPTFHFAILDQFMAVFNCNEDILIEKLKRKAVGKERVDIYEYLNACALDIICESAMGVNIESQKNQNQDYSEAVKSMCRIPVERNFSILKKNDFLFKFHPDYKKMLDNINILHTFTNSVIDKRIDELKRTKTEEKKDDLGRKKKMALLDGLLNATVDGKPLSREDIREEVDTFMFAGHDTTSAAASAAFYLLSKYPEEQVKIRKELKEVVGKDRTRTLTLQDIQDMKYLDMVVKEVLRLYPSVPFVSRMILEDVDFKGHVIPKGTEIVLFIYAINRDPDYYEDPDTFQPERFQKFTGSKPYANIPFSAGPRNCIGQKYALLELKSIMAKVLMNFDILPTDPPHQVILASEVVLKSTNGVFIRLNDIDW